MKGINRSLSSIESSVDLTIKHSLDPKLLNLWEGPDHIKEYFNTHHQLDRLDLEMTISLPC